MTIDWMRVPRQGRIASHWIGRRPDGRMMIIRQRVNAISKRGRSVSTFLYVSPNSSAIECPTVADAKRLAAAAVKL